MNKRSCEKRARRRRVLLYHSTASRERCVCVTASVLVALTSWSTAVQYSAGACHIHQMHTTGQRATVMVKKGHYHCIVTIRCNLNEISNSNNNRDCCPVAQGVSG